MLKHKHNRGQGREREEISNKIAKKPCDKYIKITKKCRTH